MSRIFVSGLGAVSPAGWGMPALRAALEQGQPLPTQPLLRPGWDTPLPVREVPKPASRLPFMAHPRLRRSSPLSHYAMAAAAEAYEPLKAAQPKLGLVVCLYCGCIQHSYRFFDEALKDPATASPLVFPETVFAAPGSHMAAFFANVSLVSTLVGDPATVLQGLALGVDWLLEHRVDAVLVVGAEETNWLLGDAVRLFEPQAILSGGAGAICLSLEPKHSLGAELGLISEAHIYSSAQTRAQAAARMRNQIPVLSGPELLCDGLQDLPKADTPELAAWTDWTGPRLSPKKVLGEGLMAASAWQCVAACDALALKRYSSALVSLVGCNQQAIGARFLAV